MFMNSHPPFNPLEQLDIEHKHVPYKAINWALHQAQNPLITTNFKPYSVVLLHAVTRFVPDIPVIWVDTGFNTPETLNYAQEVQAYLGLNLIIYRPSVRKSVVIDRFKGVPHYDSPLHSDFTELVKLQPFRKAFSDFQPDLWFTNIRRGQTAFRDTLDIASFSKDGILKVSPFYYWNSGELHDYVDAFDLPMDWTYEDPTKGLVSRECGIQY